MARKSRRAQGSGRRGDRSTEAQPLAGSIPESITQRVRTLLEEQDIAARLIQFVHDAYGPCALDEAWEEFRCSDCEIEGEVLLKFTADSPFLEQFTSWLVHTWTPAKLPAKPKGLTSPDSVPTRIFLALHPDMDPLLARYLGASVATPFSFFEVLQCEMSRRFACRDLICGTQHVVIDGAAATLLRAHQILYARIVEIEGASVIDANAPWALPEDMKPAILALGDVIMESHSGSIEPAHARHSLLVHESDLRMFYWGFIEQALKEDSLRPQVRYNRSPHRAAERLSKMLAPKRTATEKRAEDERLLAVPEIRQEIVSRFTFLYETWVEERLVFFGNKTALEAVATPEGRMKVEALMEEIETVFSLLPFALDQTVFRRVRERLGFSFTKRLN
jgi:hypothetical protein